MKNKVVVISIFVALEMILKSYLSITTPYMRISFAFFPLAIIGILYGSVSAGLVAGIADLLSILIYPTVFHPGFTLSAILTGIVFGFFLYKRERKIWRVLGAVIIVNFFINTILNSIWVYQMTGEAILLLLPGRILQNVIMTPIAFFTIWFTAYRIASLRTLMVEEEEKNNKYERHSNMREH